MIAAPVDGIRAASSRTAQSGVPSDRDGFGGLEVRDASSTPAGSRRLAALTTHRGVTVATRPSSDVTRTVTCSGFSVSAVQRHDQALLGDKICREVKGSPPPDFASNPASRLPHLTEVELQRRVFEPHTTFDSAIPNTETPSVTRTQGHRQGRCCARWSQRSRHAAELTIDMPPAGEWCVISGEVRR